MNSKSVNIKKFIAAISMIALYIILFLAFAGIDYFSNKASVKGSLNDPDWKYYLIITTVSMIFPVYYIIKRWKDIK